ncbi:DUF3800 domain-containing protein [Candidatus Gottesmanbacteria bacterium]|nr:DUF3800 domain-containing protein [Candidatus Gottesmanbacteria bacterium]
MFTYLDESGTLTQSDGNYFIVATYSVGDARKITKAFRKWQKTKFPKKLQRQTELKFNDSHIRDKLRLKTLQYFAKQDIRIFYTYLKKKNIPQEYYKKGKVTETGLLYTEIVRATLELYMPVTESQFTVVRDQRTLKGVAVNKFDETLKASYSLNFQLKCSFRFKLLILPVILSFKLLTGYVALWHDITKENPWEKNFIPF